MIRARFLKLLTKAGMAALVLAGLATGGNAQNTYQGKFTLAVETQWGDVTIPPGNYSFALPSKNRPYTLYIKGKEFSAIVMAVSADDGVVSDHAQLDLVDIADVPTVRTFEAKELGVTFSYWAPAQKHMGRTEARQKTTPATAPASQVSENKTSIEVHTTSH